MKGTVLILAVLGMMLVVGSGEASGASSIAGSHEVTIAEKRPAVLKTRSDVSLEQLDRAQATNESRPPRPKGDKERPNRDDRQREKKPKPPAIDPPPHPRPPPGWLPRPIPRVPVVEVIYYDRARYPEEPYRLTELAGIASLSLATASTFAAFGEEPHKTLAVSSIVVGAGTITSAFVKGEGRSWIMAAGVASFALGWYNLVTDQKAVISTTTSF